jgi:topoisomerase-4 subunit A
VRARWDKEETGRGTWVAVVTQIPYLVPKSRLIEKIAELINERKLPLVADVRDESAETVRIVIEPRSRSVDADVMMEQLFKFTELESRFPLNLNVLTNGQVPKVVSLADVLKEWLDHRRTVLQRRTRFRLAEIKHRLEVLGGYLIAYLNLDVVIRIIRTEDEPKPVLMKRFKLTEVQADAILNMRLRNLRKLEEMEIKSEHKALTEEQKTLEKLLASPAQQWKKIASQIKEVREAYGPATAIGKRRTHFEKAPDAEIAEAVEQAMVEREPITVVVSEKGWIRALRGHQQDVSNLSYKGDDGLKLSFFAETTSKLLVFASNGRFYTIDAAKLPGGRGYGEPIRLYIDLDQTGDVIDVRPYVGKRKFLVASHAGNGFIVNEDEVLGTTRKGKQVLNVKAPDRAAAIALAEGDTVATIGDNRKMVLFPIAELPEMGRGRGVRLQRYKEGGLSDVAVFRLDEGMTWTDTADRSFTLDKKELADWRGKRADAGRLAPKGFPKSNKFG